MVLVAVPLACAAVLAVEVLLARRGTQPAGAPLRLDGEVGAAPGGPTLRLLWLGDSTAAGVGASGPGASLPHQVAERLGRPTQLRVLAVSGATVADVVAHQLPAVWAASGDRPDAVLVSVGANDTVHLTTTGAFRSRYRRLLAGLPAGVPVVLLGVPDMGSPPRLAQPLRAIAGWRGRALDREIRALAGSRHLTYVDIAGPTGPPFRRHPGRYFSADRYHPSDAGYALWAAAVVAAWRP